MTKLTEIDYNNHVLTDSEITAIKDIFMYYEKKTQKYNKSRVFLGEDVLIKINKLNDYCKKGAIEDENQESKTK